MLKQVSIYAGAKASGQITYSMTVFASMTDRTNANLKSVFLITSKDKYSLSWRDSKYFVDLTISYFKNKLDISLESNQ